MSRPLRPDRIACPRPLAASLLTLVLLGCGPGSTAGVSGQIADGGHASTFDAGSTPDAGEAVDAGPAAVPSSEKAVTAFVLKASDNPALTADVAGTIDDGEITVQLPSGVAVTALTPTVTTTGVSLSPESGVAKDFTSPVVYTVTAEDGSTATYTATAIAVAAPACTTSAASCSLDVYNRAVAFATAHPTRSNGGTWNQYCGALMMEFGGFSASAPSAIAAYRGSSIVSTDPTTAPIGAFHYFNLGQYGHVGVDLLGEGAVVFMATSHVGSQFGSSPYLGVNSVDGYMAASGATYLGWSMTYNGHGQTLSGGGDCGAASVPSGCAIPKTPAQTSGTPDHAFVMRMQQYAAQHGYTGAINGTSDAATWAGVQRGLQAYGYTGPVNGLPGANTYKAFQRLAAAHGYTGPVNGILGPNTVRGFAKFLNDTY